MLPDKLIVRLIETVLNKYNKADTKWIYEICNPSDKFQPIPKEWFDDLVDLQFCGIPVKAVSHYTEYLAARFGDISGLHPEDQRHPSHDIVEVSLLRE